ncbi:hypothetical protein BJ970_003291 [Saccharopolyspora phatthalungensis]|uniref:Immunity protein Imm1 n=2 Tax=Saccharopolyspora phatthalungensis TaxID=664693 RepID=A0A840Q725_9PSEU|nr:hypothetical protein [Saccharopolyspora phatthalungensis]
MELDDQTPLDAADVRATLTSQMSDEHVIVYLVHDNGTELAIGFRDGRGVCLWQICGDDPAVTTGGTNDDVIVYGWSEIPVPAGAELDAETVIEAAEEFAKTGTRPTGVQWRPYGVEAFPLERSPGDDLGLR